MLKSLVAKPALFLLGLMWLVTTTAVVQPAAQGIEIVAGIPNTAEEGAYGGGGGPAIQARLAKPLDVAVDGAGNIFITDAANNRVRRVDITSGLITTVAGTGVAGFSGHGGLATKAQLEWPTGLVVDGTSELYIADSMNLRIR